ncbi:MAG: ATPase [Bacteroidetes bacterium SW_9_63_38]|nr:MAG: ATPase [Bacteroidetes bacterium SW_9_63_38]
MSDIVDRDQLRCWLGLIEEPPAFRKLLRRLQWKGLQLAGILGLACVSVHVGFGVLLFDDAMVWTWTSMPRPEVLSVPDKLFSIGLCLVLFGVGRRRCSLRTGRALAAAAALLGAAASLYSDLQTGVLAFEYLMFILIATAATIPFRPWQTGLLGLSLIALLLLSRQIDAAVSAIPEASLVSDAHLLRTGVMTLIMSGVSVLLYASRYRQYRTRHHAEALRDEYEALEAEKSRLFANLSHELRSPLTLLQSPLQDALNGQYGALPQPFAERLSDMKKQTDRLQSLVDQLLQLSKLDEGKMELEAQPVRLDKMLDHMRSLFQSAAKQKSIEVRLETDGAPTACVDPNALQKILSNLLSNAFEHTPDGGTIRLRARSQSLEPDSADDFAPATLSVRDSGPGLPEDVQDNLFQRYVGVAPEGSSPFDASTGIGLAVVKELAERHGGSVETNSEPGFGTEILVTLPRTCDALPDEDVLSDSKASPHDPFDSDLHYTMSTRELEALSAPEESESAPPPPEDERPEVLVVDDEQDVRTYLEEVLAPRYAVRSAADGNEALESMREHPPALVVSDVVMPHRDGFELCRAIRADESLRTIPIILLTVQRTDQSKRMGIREGADAYVGKPFHPEELRQRVENLIEVRSYIRKEQQQATTAAPAPDGLDIPSDENSESAFLARAHDVVDDHLGNSSFGVDWFADEMELSTRQLQRRLQEETGLSAASFTRALRLRRAADLLRTGDVTTVADAADAVGYRDPSYFSQLFKEVHGAPPSEFKA